MLTSLLRQERANGRQNFLEQIVSSRLQLQLQTSRQGSGAFSFVSLSPFFLIRGLFLPLRLPGEGSK